MSIHKLTARTFLAAVMILGFSAVIYALVRFETVSGLRFAAFLGAAMVASGLKLRLPGITGTMSVNFLFILLALAELSLPEVILLSLAASLCQTYYRPKTPPKLTHVLFNSSLLPVAAFCAHAVHVTPELAWARQLPLLELGAAATTYFLVNTGAVSIIIGLTERKSPVKVWQECYFWSFSYHLMGAGMAGGLYHLKGYFGWGVAVAFSVIVVVIYRSYRLYLERLEDEKAHAEEMASLHLRTISALAMAIEAKDETTHDHLQRVQHYAVEIGREMGVSDEELKALRAASVLHDIGKLAVPEHIISKPGKLTPEEFEKIKIHPVVGAEIVERVQFPYPVAPVVAAHHEKWDGSGYPYGLKGEEIPIGARILSVVDCLDALATDRQYRRALPLDEAMEAVSREAGRSFDPQVVAILKRRYLELEAAVKSTSEERAKLRSEIKIERGEAPANGFAGGSRAPETETGSRKPSFLASIAAARHEAQTLFELANNLGSSLSLQDTLSMLEARLKPLVPFDTIAVYRLLDNVLIPAHVAGQGFELFSTLSIPVESGLTGWVAANKKPILNGNPSVEVGYEHDPAGFSTLRSAISVPLEAVDGVVGVITLYHRQPDAFTRDHLRILLAISSKIAKTVENAIRYERAEISAAMDSLTGLPNASSLFMRLDEELARCRRESRSLTVLVCDLDGFKQVNDRHGHLAGNQVLRRVGLGFQNLCREYDYVARMGGDEFVVLLSDIRPEALTSKIRALNAVVKQAGRETCGENLLSVSVGEASFPRDGSDAEDLLAMADRRMYKLKDEAKRGIIAFDGLREAGQRQKVQAIG